MAMAEIVGCHLGHGYVSSLQDRVIVLQTDHAPVPLAVIDPNYHYLGLLPK